jgi:hypothetical protein
VTTELSGEISDWTVDMPAGWFTVPMTELAAHEESRWIEGIVDEVREMAAEPGSPTELRSQLSRVRAQLLARQSPWLNAAVLVRPEDVMSIGCVLLTSVLGLEAGDGPDAFEAMLEDGFARPARGTHTHASRVWRDRIDAGELVGSYQRFEIVDFGEGIGTVEDRTIYGVFPDHSSDMIRLEFRAGDLAAFDDIIDATSTIVRSASVVLSEPA